MCRVTIMWLELFSRRFLLIKAYWFRQVPYGAAGEDDWIDAHFVTLSQSTFLKTKINVAETTREHYYRGLSKETYKPVGKQVLKPLKSKFLE